MQYTLEYVELRGDQVSQVPADPGIYQIIALPFAESKKSLNSDIVKGYVDFCQAAYLHSWEGKVNAQTSFKDRSVAIDLCQHKTTHIKKAETYLDQTSKPDLHDFFLQFLPFLPSLYIGVSSNLQSCFTDHTNMNDADSTLYKLTKDKDYLSFKNCKKYFMWKPIKIDVNPLNPAVSEDEILDELETVMIQTRKPLIRENYEI